jgi:hypothetical protein
MTSRKQNLGYKGRGTIVMMRLGWKTFLRPVLQPNARADWSLLTILLADDGALCSHESQRKTSPVGSLPHLRREAGRKV